MAEMIDEIGKRRTKLHEIYKRCNGEQTRAELSLTMPYHIIISESKTNQLLRINLSLSLLCKQCKHVYILILNSTRNFG